MFCARGLASLKIEGETGRHGEGEREREGTVE